jgi:hypothetical protein
MPAAFTPLFKTLTLNALPNFRVVLDEGMIQAKEVEAAAWVMTLHAYRILPHYTYAPSNDNTLNGLVDCVAGSGLTSLIFAPCLIQGDSDRLDVEIRDAQSRLIKSYHFEEEASGVTLIPPLTFLFNRDETVRWQQLGEDLYTTLSADKVFSNTFISTPPRLP